MAAGPEIVETLQFLQETAPQQPDLQRELEAGLATRVYGPFLERMIDYGRTSILHGTLDTESAVNALVIASRLYQAADQDYATQENTLTDEELAVHQANVLSGTIVTAPEGKEVFYHNGVRQVERANRALYGQPGEVQAALAELNYGAVFNAKTMASAAHTLDRGELDSLLAILGKDQKAMPHLTATNWAIGQTAAGVYRFASESELPIGINVFDIGSGQGSTIAAITNSLSLESVDRRPKLSITGLETTQRFYKDLADFVDIDQGATALGLTPVRYKPEMGIPISEPGTITTIKADVLDALKGLDLPTGKDVIDFFAANYALHRLGDDKKLQILRLLDQRPNVIFAIGDLAQNTSKVNRGYFDLSLNGPLNAGNMYLKEMLQSFGFSVVDLKIERPASLDERLAKRIVQESEENDGHLWVAHRGELAKQALNLVAA